MCNHFYAASGSGVAKPVSKLDKDRQRKERQKQRKLVELESALQNALDVLSKKGLRSVIPLKQINSNTTIIKRLIILYKNQGFSVSSGRSRGGGLHHGLGKTKVGAWMPRAVGVVLAH